MANRVQYTIGINADTSQAKKALSDLQKSLDAIQNSNRQQFTLDLDIERAANAAKTLQQQLTAATNVNTGQLNMNLFMSNLEKANIDLRTLSQTMVQCGTQGQQAFTNLANVIATSDVPVKRLNSTLAQFGTTLKNAAKWTLSSNIIHGLESAFSGAIHYAESLNETLNNIRIVTNATVDDMAKFAQQANAAAKELSTTTRAYADASLIYFQQGDDAATVAKKAAITTKAANVAFTASAQEMSEMLTALWNSYQVGDDQLEHTVDVLAKLGGTTASSMEEMATAMQKVAATANTVGVSMEQMSAIVATSASVTRQAPQNIGTAWNTILSRIGGLKLGETLEDGVTLNKYSQAMSSVGIQVLDASNNLREMGTVIDELGEKWNTLTNSQKSALAQTIGGARQYTQIMAFFENFDQYQKNFQNTQNADGTLNQQQEISAQSWEAASKRVQASLESIYSSLLNDEFIIKFTNGINELINAVDNFIKGLGGIKGILTTLGGTLTSVFSKQIAASIQSMGLSMVKFFTGKDAQATAYIANLERMQAVFRELRDSASTSAEGQQIEALTTILDLKTKLATNTKNLSADEVASINSVIDSLSNESQALERVLATQQQYEEALQSSTAQNFQATSQALGVNNSHTLFDELWMRAASDQNISPNDSSVLETIINFSDRGYNSFVQHVGDWASTESTLDGVISKLAQLRDATGDTDSKTKEYTTTVQNLQELFQDHPLGNEISQAFTQANGDIDNFIQQLRQIKETNINQQFGTSTINELTEALERLGFITDDNRQHWEALIATSQNLGRSLVGTQTGLTNIKDQAQRTSEEIDRLKNRTDNFATTATKLSSALMSVSGGLSSFSNLSQGAVDGTLNLTQAIGSLSGGLMSTMMLFKTISSITALGSLAVPLGAIAAGATVIGGTILGVTQANDQKDEENRKNQMTKAVERSKQITDENNKLNELWSTYQQLEQSRLTNNEVSEGYINNVQNLIDSLENERLKVLALSGQYDELAKAAKESYKERLHEQTTEVEQKYNEYASNVKARGESTVFVQTLPTDVREQLKKINGTDATSITAYDKSSSAITIDLDKVKNDPLSVLQLYDFLNSSSFNQLTKKEQKTLKNELSFIDEDFVNLAEERLSLSLTEALNNIVIDPNDLTQSVARINATISSIVGENFNSSRGNAIIRNIVDQFITPYGEELQLAISSNRVERSNMQTQRRLIGENAQSLLDSSLTDSSPQIQSVRRQTSVLQTAQKLFDALQNGTEFSEIAQMYDNLKLPLPIELNTLNSANQSQQAIYRNQLMQGLKQRFEDTKVTYGDPEQLITELSTFRENAISKFTKTNLQKYNTTYDATKNIADHLQALNITDSTTMKEIKNIDDGKTFKALQSTGIINQSGKAFTEYGLFIINHFNELNQQLEQSIEEAENQILSGKTSIDTSIDQIQWNDKFQKIDTDVSKWTQDQYDLILDMISKSQKLDQFDWAKDIKNFDLLSQTPENIQNILLDLFQEVFENSDFSNDDLRKGQAKAVLDAYKKQIINRDAEKDLTSISTRINDLQNELQVLTKLDLSSAPIKGTQAYEQLDKALKKVGSSVEDLYGAEKNQLEQIDLIYKAQDEQLSELEQEQQKQIDRLQEQRKNLKQGGATDKELTELDQKIYEARQKLKETQDAQLENDQQANLDRQKELANIYTQLQAQQKRQQDDLSQSFKNVDIYAKAITDGTLTAAESVNLNTEKWDQCATAAERAAFVASSYSEAIVNTQSQLDDINSTYGELIKKYQDSNNLNTKKGWTNSTFQEYLKSQDLTEKQQSLLNQAVSRLQTQGGMALKDISLQNVIDELERMKKDGIGDIDALKAAALDSIKNVGSTLAADMQQQAKNATDAWLTFFDTISKAREALIQKNNTEALGTLFGDTSSILAAWNSLNEREGGNPYKNMGEFYRAVQSGQFDYKNLQYQSLTDYTQSEYNRLNIPLFNQAYGNMEEQRSAGYTNFSYLNALKDVVRSSEVLGDIRGVSPDGVNELIEGYIEQYISALLQEINGKEATSEEIKEYLKNSDLLENLIASSLPNLQEAIRFRGQQMTYVQSVNEQDKQFAQSQEDYNKQHILDVEEDQKDLELIQKAQSAYDNDKHGLNTQDFSKEEISRLEELIGKPFDQIKLADLNNGASEAASALYELADAAKSAFESQAQEAGYAQDENGIWHHTDTDENGNTILTDEVEGMTEKAHELDKAIEAAGQTVANVGTKNFDGLASSVGMTRKEFEEYIDINKEAGKIIGETSDELAANAAMLARQTKGFDDAQSNMKGYMSTLKKTNNTSNEHIKTLHSVRKIYADLFDLTEGEAKHLSGTFLESEKNAKLLEKAIKGDEKAWDQLTAAAAEDIFKNMDMSDIIDPAGVLNDVSGLITDIQSYLDGADLEVGADLNDAPFMSKLSQMQFASLDAANAMTAALSSIGVEAEIEEHTVSTPQRHYETEFSGNVQVPIMAADGRGIDYVDGSASGIITEDTPETSQTYYTIKGATYNGRGVTGGGASSPKKSGGGGGGGKEHQPKDHKRVQDEGERYHQVRQQLETQSNLLEKIDKLKEKTYGTQHLKNIEKEIELLKEENALQQKYYDEAARWLATDRAELESYGATFAADGTLNYDEYISKIVNEYNARVDASPDDETDKEIDKWFEDAKKAIDNYEEAYHLVETTQNDILENQNKISAALLESTQYKVEIRVTLNEKDIATMDYYIQKWERMLERQDEGLEASINKVYSYEDSLDSLGIAYDELIAAHYRGELNDSDFVEGLQDVQDQILDNLGSIDDLKKEIQDWLDNTLNDAEDALDKYSDKLSHGRDVMQDYIEMAALMGKGVDYSGLSEMYTVSYEASLMNAQAAKEYVDILKDSRQTILDQVQQYGWTEELKKQFDDLEQHLIKAENELLEATQQTLKDAQAAFENTMKQVLKDARSQFSALTDAVSGAVKEWSDIADQYDWWKQQQKQYVSTAKELYEVSKINREIEKSIAGTTTEASKERLKLLQQEINAYAEKNRLTEYDIEMNELQYQMALAQQNLEEAGTNNMTVRLTRDMNGNYGYQYTANPDEISEARQKYEDVLQQINELASQHYIDLNDMYIEEQQRHEEAVLKITEMTENDLVLRNQLLEEEEQRHYQTIEYINGQMERNYDQLLTNQSYIEQRYGESIVANTGMVQDQMSITMNSMQLENDKYLAYLREQAVPQMSAALSEYEARLQATKTVTGYSWQGMQDSIESYRDTSKEAQKQIQETDKTLVNTINGIAAATSKWLEHGTQLQQVISKYENLNNAIQSIVRSLDSVASAAYSAASAISSVNYARDSYSGSGKSSKSSGSGSGSNNAAKNSGGGKSSSFSLSGEVKAYWNNADYAAATRTPIKRNATGGINDYTGWAWMDGTLQQPELVLNAGDTQNMLKMINILHNLSPEMLSALNGSFSQSAISQLIGMNTLTMPTIGTRSEELQQNVHIEAEFPNVTDRDEIKEAFNDLVNLASQYASRK